MDLGFPEILLILVVVLIVFGAGKLPEVGGAIGKAMHDFRKASRGDLDEEGRPTKPGELSDDMSGRAS
ncbi:MAG: twin-arginine translocase TatA/TatE family subunit [Chloroflexi bacterium]|nr:twin-arginine translocase TatA/TatE family subunit [Chloroflexota bacterium]